MRKTVIALYNELSTARKVELELIQQGFERDDISLIASDAKGEYATAVNQSDDATEGAILGAGMGGVVGGIGGLLVGLGAMAIPGIGPVVAAGPLIGTLVGAGVGAASGGVLGALTSLDIPEDQAHIYLEAIRRGGTLVSLQTDAARANHAVNIMNRYNPINLEHNASKWRESGWNGFDEQSASNAAYVNKHGETNHYDPNSGLLITPHGVVGIYPSHFGAVH